MVVRNSLNSQTLSQIYSKPINQESELANKIKSLQDITQLATKLTIEIASVSTNDFIV